MNFVLRGVAYISVVFVGLFFLLKYSGNFKYRLFFNILLLIVFANFLRYPFIAGWTYQIQKDQVYPVRVLGIDQNILLDQKRYELLKKMKDIVPNGSEVVVSHHLCWGYVYLLDLKPPYLYFDFYPNLFIDYIKENPHELNQLTFIELEDIPFPREFFKQLMSITNEEVQIKKVVIGESNVISEKIKLNQDYIDSN